MRIHVLHGAGQDARDFPDLCQLPEIECQPLSLFELVRRGHVLILQQD